MPRVTLSSASDLGAQKRPVRQIDAMLEFVGPSLEQIWFHLWCCSSTLDWRRSVQSHAEQFREDISIEGYGFIETTSDGSGFAHITAYPGFTCSWKLAKILMPFCFAFTRNPSYFLNSSFLQTMLISAGERILSESVKYMDRKRQDFPSSWCLSSISLGVGFKLRISSIASPAPSCDRKASFCTLE